MKTVRDVEQAELLESSRRVRGQLAELVATLEKHVCALQAEVERLQIKDSKEAGQDDD